MVWKWSILMVKTTGNELKKFLSTQWRPNHPSETMVWELVNFTGAEIKKILSLCHSKWMVQWIFIQCRVTNHDACWSRSWSNLPSTFFSNICMTFWLESSRGYSIYVNLTHWRYMGPKCCYFWSHFGFSFVTLHYRPIHDTPLFLQLDEDKSIRGLPTSLIDWCE